MADTPKKNEWFEPKRSGLGYRPAGWKGWLITLGGVLIIIAVVYVIRSSR